MLSKTDNSSVWEALRPDGFLLLCLFLSVSSIIPYAKFLIIPVFVLIYKTNLSKQERITGIWLIVFSVAWFFAYLLRGNISSTSDYVAFLLTPVFYRAGCYLGAKYQNDERALIVIVFLMIVLYSCVFFSTIVQSLFLHKGAIIEDRNNLLDTNDSYTSATFYGIVMSVLIAGLAFIFVPKQTGTLKWVRICGIIMALLAVWGMFTIVTRTSLIESMAVLLFSVFMMMFERKRKIGARGFLIGLIVIVGVVYFVTSKLEYVEFVEAFEARNAVSGLETAGSRVERWLAALIDILNNPFGTSTGHLMSHSSLGFAHNMWLDIGLTAGWIPFIIIVVFSIRNIKQTIIFWKNKRYSYIIRAYFFSLFLVFTIGCFAEPILSAIYSHFLMYLVFCGIISELCYKQDETIPIS